MKCTSCSMETQKLVKLSCPKCKNEILRCSRCRNLSIEYKCSKCEHKGP